MSLPIQTTLRQRRNNKERFMITLLVTSLATTLCINFVLFLIAYRRQSDKLTDFAYSLSFITVTILVLVQAKHYSFVLYAMAIMVLLWALRLGSFLVFRIRKSGKDARFDDLRGNFFKFLKFWLAQGLVAWLLLLPLIFTASNDVKTGASFIVGVIIYIGGLLVETVADQQKYRFKQRPENKNLWIDEGIWHYSRHPNYFGEICVWVGLYIAAFAGMSGIERSIGLVSPLAIAVSLLFISGIPILEKSADNRWGKDKNYQNYKKRTSLLIPLWPKK